MTNISIENADSHKLLMTGETFDFLNTEENLYSEKDLIERYE